MDNLSYTLTSYSGLPGCPSYLSSPQRLALFSRTESSSGVPWEAAPYLYVGKNPSCCSFTHLGLYQVCSQPLQSLQPSLHLSVCTCLSQQFSIFNWKVVSENFLHCSLKILSYLHEMGNIKALQNLNSSLK